MQFRLLTAAAMLALLACTRPASAITNGEPDNGRHPNTGAIVMIIDPFVGRPVPRIRCSGVLIGPRILLTAGHCTAVLEDHVAAGGTLANFRVSFGDDALIPGSWHEIAAAYTHPDYMPATNSSSGGGAKSDMGIVILAQAVEGVEPATLAPLGFLDLLQDLGELPRGPKAPKFGVAGYGTQLELYPRRLLHRTVSAERRTRRSRRCCRDGW